MYPGEVRRKKPQSCHWLAPKVELRPASQMPFTITTPTPEVRHPFAHYAVFGRGDNNGCFFQDLGSVTTYNILGSIGTLSADNNPAAPKSGFAPAVRDDEDAEMNVNGGPARTTVVVATQMMGMGATGRVGTRSPRPRSGAAGARGSS